MKHPLLLAVLTLTMVACAPQANRPDIDVEQPTAAKRTPVEWYAYDMGDDEQGIPQNKLVLKAVSPTRDELFETACAGTTLVQGVPDLDESVAYIQCWWAGGGDQFAVFIEDGEKAIIRHRTVDEEAGYGRWEDLKSL